MQGRGFFWEKRSVSVNKHWVLVS